MGGYVFADCPTVTKHKSVIPLATGDEVIKFWKAKVKGQGRWGGMRSKEPF